MRKTIVDNWDSIMNHNKNPLKNIPDTNTRHMIIQILAWMWCIVFSLYFTSWVVFGFTAVAHFLIIFGTFMTAIIFKKGGEFDQNKP